MRLLVIRIVLLWLLLTFLIGGAVSVGSHESPSSFVLDLHLADCLSSCWLGITPGKTTLADALQILDRNFELAPPHRDIVGAKGDRTLTPAFTGMVSQQILLSRPGHPVNISFQVIGGLIDEITITSLYFENGKLIPYLPALGDVVNALGPPACVRSFRTLNKLIFARETASIAVNAGPDLHALMQPIQSLSIQKPGTVSELCDVISPWLGFASESRYEHP